MDKVKTLGKRVDMVKIRSIVPLKSIKRYFVRYFYYYHILLLIVRLKLYI